MHEIEDTEGYFGYLNQLWRRGADDDNDQYDVLDNKIDETRVAEQVSGGCGGAGGEPPTKRFKLLNRSYALIDLTADCL